MAPRKVFAQELESLRQDIIQMGAEVEELVKQTIIAITTRDKELAKKVIAKDDYIDQVEVEIERRCVTLIAHQQPLARDLRLIMSILKIVTDMERIADQCEDICMYSLQLQDESWSHEESYKRHIENMAIDVQGMLKRAIDGFVEKDVVKMREICKYDDKIDADFKRIWQEIVEEMGRNKEFIPKGADYLMIIKYFERIADHTTNIAEWLIYNVTGDIRFSE